MDSGALAFVNHGCKGSYNTGTKTPFDEFTVSLDVPHHELVGRSHSGSTLFNPVIDRHLQYQCDQSLRDIQAGEEILDNYLAFSVANADDWANNVMTLREWCSGERSRDAEL